jgi:hypothetical protein
MLAASSDCERRLRVHTGQAPYEFFSDENPIVEGPTPPNDWEACSFQCSIPSPLDGAARAQFRLDAQIANAQINDEVGGDFMRPKECFDCECLYADLNEYLVYRRRRKVQP